MRNPACRLRPVASVPSAVNNPHQTAELAVCARARLWLRASLPPQFIHSTECATRGHLGSSPPGLVQADVCPLNKTPAENPSPFPISKLWASPVLIPDCLAGVWGGWAGGRLEEEKEKNKHPIPPLSPHW